MKNRRLWFLVHGWLSLPVWVLFCFICITGTIAVVSHELTWLTNPDARANNPENLPAKPLPELVAAAEAAVPDARVHSVMVFEPYLVTAVQVSSKEVPYALVYVNPYSGQVQAVNQGLTFIGLMRSLHGWLLFPWQAGYSIGYYLVALMSLVVLGALITGVVIYKKFWRSYTQPRVRTDRGSRALLGDLHRLGGAWSLWFLLIMGLTGLWYLTQAIIWHNGGDVWQHPDPVPLSQLPLSQLPVTGGEAPPRVPLAQALAAAQAQFPELQPSWIAMPDHNRDYYSIAGSGPAILFDQYSYRAFINPWNGEVAELRRPGTMNALQTVSHLADPLHYGNFAGLGSKLVWFVFGLILSAMSITGFLIWGKRTAQAVRAPAAGGGARGRLQERTA